MLAFSFKAFSVEADIAKGLLQYTTSNEQYGNRTGDGGVTTDDDNNRKNSNDNDETKENTDDIDSDVIVTYDDDDYTSMMVEKAMGAREMLAISMSGLARPLKSRIVQVIATLSRHPGGAAGRAAGSDRTTTNHGGGGDDNDNDDDDDDEFGLGDDVFGEECSRLHTKIAQLYDICGLLLFYITVMDKSIEKFDPSSAQQQPPSRSSRISTFVPTYGYNNEAYLGSTTDGGGSSSSSSNPLVTNLIECFKESTIAYEATVRVYCAMVEQWSVLIGDPEAALIHALVVRIADVRINSPGFDTADDVVDGAGAPTAGSSSQLVLPTTIIETLSSPSSTTSDNNYLYGTILSMEWLTRTLIESCLSSSKGIALDDISYLTQALAASKKAGLDVVTFERLVNEISKKEGTLIDELVSSEVAHVLDLCGLGLIAAPYESWKAETTTNAAATGGTTSLMSTYPGLSQSVVEASIQEFYTSLYSPPIPTLENVIKDPVVRRVARTKISDTITQLYTELYDTIISNNDTLGGYARTEFLEHPPVQVKTLFSV
jgi:conserved oligomeric Golgi complex subunit 6